MSDGTKLSSALSQARRHRPELPRVSVVIPALNEARNLEVVLPLLPAVHEVILVDGGSVDGTIETAERVMPDIRIVRQTRRGKGNALACGFGAVTGDIVVMFDADGSADAAEIPAFVDALISGADFAKGSRFCPGGGSVDITGLRKLGNKFLTGTTNAVFSQSFSDLCYGYNAFWADVLGVLDLPDTTQGNASEAMQWGDGFEIETVLICRAAAGGLRIREVPSVELQRIHGESNLNAVRDGLRVLYSIRSERARGRRLPAPIVSESDAEAARHFPTATASAGAGLHQAGERGFGA